jgi:hypothetical protein
MPPERITLPRQVREYFSAIGKRGGASGRRELTRQQAKLLVALREEKRAAKKAGMPAPAFSARQLAPLRKPKSLRP